MPGQEARSHMWRVREVRATEHPTSKGVMHRGEDALGASPSRGGLHRGGRAWRGSRGIMALLDCGVHIGLGACGRMQARLAEQHAGLASCPSSRTLCTYSEPCWDSSWPMSEADTHPAATQPGPAFHAGGSGEHAQVIERPIAQGSKGINRIRDTKRISDANLYC